MKSDEKFLKSLNPLQRINSINKLLLKNMQIENNNNSLVHQLLTIKPKIKIFD